MQKSEQDLLAKISAQLNAGQFASAAKTARSGTQKFPRNPAFANFAGLAQAQAGKHRDAAVFFAKAMKLAPRHEEIETNLIQALVFSDQQDKAQELIARCPPRPRNPAGLHYLNAQSLSRAGDQEAALAAASAAKEAGPDNPRAYYLRASILTALGRPGDALVEYRALAMLTPQDPQPLLESANALIRLSRLEEAREVLTAALKLAPDAVQAHAQLGMLSAMLGENEAASGHYRDVLKRAPAHGSAYLQLAKLQEPEANQAMLPQLEAAKAQAGSKSHDYALMCFAQAAICKQAGKAEDEASLLKAANRIEAERRPYDAAAATRQFQTLTGAIAPAAAEAEAPEPIFILGLPRSGTSLLEHVLSASGAVFGCGELPGGDAIAAAAAADGDAADTAKLARGYRAALPEFPSGTSHFIDKLPANYKIIGPLKAVFPNARFLHLQRDPRDVALSMWRAYFAQGGLNFTFDQKAMAHEVNLYRQYMDHWRGAYAESILDVPYTALTSDLETTGKQVAEFCGLSWQPAMAHPEKNAASVRTASAQQVREKVHSRSVGGWKQQEAALKVFLRGLKPALWPELDL
ncbi:tetratricopeptide repeat-containing sulfotransferase family protein [Leisingera sp. ANG-Vp]|uniref:tetratricopeptide repeat-containing sulfotransferase family protein n=1 Tax=Leisingera sp. ANG-Vp TaxID=1577896 RepID=UPI00057F6005|nr:tetratricopeptide repeat-containing sulfotransferase family protein [Leisingera sp. ANG-Vp]KIC17686.1 hypothetical protein RA20_15135 [Leisingera sp. ANG-Vp]